MRISTLGKRWKKKFVECIAHLYSVSKEQFHPHPTPEHICFQGEIYTQGGGAPPTPTKMFEGKAKVILKVKRRCPSKVYSFLHCRCTKQGKDTSLEMVFHFVFHFLRLGSRVLLLSKRHLSTVFNWQIHHKQQ